MFGSNREDLANLINEAVAEINNTQDGFAKGRKVIELAAFFESHQVPAAEAQFFLDTLKEGAESGDSESIAMLHSIAEEISGIAELEDCANASQYKGKLTKAFEAAKQVMSENGAGSKTHLVDSFRHGHIDVILGIAERVSALQGDHYTDPEALYEAIKDVTIGPATPARTPRAPKP